MPRPGEKQSSKLHRSTSMRATVIRYFNFFWVGNKGRGGSIISIFFIFILVFVCLIGTKALGTPWIGNVG